jgi:hypothetical protein
LPPELKAALDAAAKKHGFKDFNDYDEVTANITMVMTGMDAKTKVFTDPAIAIKEEIQEVTGQQGASGGRAQTDAGGAERSIEGGAADPVPRQYRSREKALRQDRCGGELDGSRVPEACSTPSLPPADDGCGGNPEVIWNRPGNDEKIRGETWPVTASSPRMSAAWYDRPS